MYQTSDLLVQTATQYLPKQATIVQGVVKLLQVNSTEGGG